MPLNIQFSAPNPTVLASRAGNILNWYQPPWEPGNVFSYAANYSQLQAEILVSLDKLSEDTSFSTDSLIETIKANWASGSGTSQSTNSTRTKRKLDDIRKGKSLRRFRAINRKRYRRRKPVI